MDEQRKLLGVAQPDYFKIDIDGIEHLILEGGTEVLAKTKSLSV